MGLEAATHISELVPTNPDGADPISQGDDHIKLVKLALKNQFPAFVGDTATPKAVLLTEDELSDAALLARANSFSATQTYNALCSFNQAPRLANDVSLNGRNAALNDTFNLAKVGVSDLIEYGDTDAQQVNRAAVQNQFVIDGVSVGFFAALASGGMIVRDLSNVSQKVGFRNPLGRQGNLTQNFVQDDEGQVFWKPTNSAEVYTCNALEAGTRITFVNTSGVGQQIVSGTAVVSGYPGGPILTSPLNIAQNTRVELWWQSSTVVQCWGGVGLT